MVAMLSEELPEAAEAEVLALLLESGADPGRWELRHLWATDDVNPRAFALVLVSGCETRAFTVGREGAGWRCYVVVP